MPQETIPFRKMPMVVVNYHGSVAPAAPMIEMHPVVGWDHFEGHVGSDQDITFTVQQGSEIIEAAGWVYDKTIVISVAAGTEESFRIPRVGAYVLFTITRAGAPAADVNAYVEARIT